MLAKWKQSSVAIDDGNHAVEKRIKQINEREQAYAT